MPVIQNSKIAPSAMANEVLCKFLCHNLTCFIQEQETLGIVPVFWKEETQRRANDSANVPIMTVREEEN